MPTFSPLESYRWEPFSPRGDSDDLDAVFAQGIQRGGDGYRQDCETLRRIYPELAHWRFAALNEAWSDYCRDVELCGFNPPVRTERFLAYIILRSIAGFGYDHYGQSGGWYDDLEQALLWRDGRGELPRP